MTAPTKRTRGRPRKLAAVSIPTHSTLGVRLTAEQRAAIEAGAAGRDLSTFVRESMLVLVGRPDLGIAGEAAKYRNDSRRNGADPDGWNVYRFREGSTDANPDLDLVAACATRETAWAAARPGDQVQRGLDGAVETV